MRVGKIIVALNMVLQFFMLSQMRQDHARTAEWRGYDGLDIQIRFVNNTLNTCDKSIISDIAHYGAMSNVRSGFTSLFVLQLYWQVNYIVTFWY